MPRKIVINGRFLGHSVTGVERYALEIIKTLDRMLDCGQIDPAKFSFILMTPSNINYGGTFKHISIKRVGKLRGHLWEQFELPFYARKQLLLNFCNAAPLCKSNQIVTIHDAAVFGFPQGYSLAFRTWYKLLIKGLGIMARKIITDSFFSQKELIKYCSIHDKKIRVIYLGKEHVYLEPDETVLQKHGLLSQEYVLAVSSINPNKNFQSIVQAVDLLEDRKYAVVIAGGANPKIFGAANNSGRSHVKYLGYISDAELKALYAHAGCFIYPSFYEGFGLPPLEAMACGCPVIVSDTASLPEICGDAAVYCDPRDPLDIARKITSVMKNGIFRQELREKGLRHVENFSWEKCARQMIHVAEEVLFR